MRHGLTFSRQSNACSFPVLRFVAVETPSSGGLSRRRRGDWVLCQVTSNPYGDPSAVAITDECFSQGSLRISSFARPGKLFTASSGLILGEVGILKANVARQIIKAIIVILQSGLDQWDIEHDATG